RCGTAVAARRGRAKSGPRAPAPGGAWRSRADSSRTAWPTPSPTTPRGRVGRGSPAALDRRGLRTLRRGARTASLNNPEVLELEGYIHDVDAAVKTQGNSSTNDPSWQGGLT